MKNLYNIFLLFLFLIPVHCLLAQDFIPEDKVEKVSLKINLEPNTSYRFVNSTTQKTIQKLMETEMETNLNSIIHYLFEVESNTGMDMKIKATYERFALTMHAQQDTIRIDTDQQEGEKASQLLPWFSSLINKPFYIFLNNQGRILKFEGLAEVLGVPEIEHSSLLKHAFNNSNLLLDIESNFHIFPEDSTSLGQTWRRDQDQNLYPQIDLTFKKAFTLEGLSEDLAWVNIEHDIKNDPSKISPSGEINITGTQQGMIEIDRNTGLILFSETQQELEGSIKAHGIAIPLNISSTNTLNGEKL